MNLTFFIPTYNRVDSLQKSISSILEFWEDDCKDIIISDNNIDHIAKDVVDKFDSHCIRYFQNKENIGIDKNMVRFLDLCKTQYCWLLGDDDSLNKKSYKSVSSLLQEDVDFIILLNGSHVKEYSDGIFDINDSNKIGKAFLSFWDKIPFGNVIVNAERAKCLDYNKVLQKYEGTSHAYSGILWELASSDFSSKKIAIVTAKNIEVSNVEKTWANSLIKIYLSEIPEWFRLLPHSLKEYSNKAFTNYLKQIFTSSLLLNYILFSKQSKINNDFINKEMKKMPLNYKLKWIVAKAFFPVYKIYAVVKRFCKK